MFEILFWIGVCQVMAALYTSPLGSFGNALALAALLLPGAIFAQWSLARIKQLNGAIKWLRLFYALIISLYLEWSAMLVAYWLLFELEVKRIPALMVNPIYLWMWMLFFAFLYDRIFVKATKLEPAVNFALVSAGKRVTINLNELYHIESKNEICYLYMTSSVLETRERISSLEKRLPEHVMRIHRSFMVNSKKLDVVTKDEVVVNGTKLPVSRSYKEQVALLMG